MQQKADSALADGEQKRRRVQPDWAKLLDEALNKPGSVNQAYSLFHNFSLPNSFWLMCQLFERGMEPGPVASFRHWQRLGRQVRKGERAFFMYMPVTVVDGGRGRGGSAPAKSNAGNATGSSTGFASRPEDAAGDGEAAEPTRRRVFIARGNWFVLAQTDPIEGAEQATSEVSTSPSALRFSLAQALQGLGLRLVPFSDTNGNCQGFARPNAKEIAVSPIAADATKTSIHEMAHCLLHPDTEEFVDGEVPGRSLKEVEAESTAYIVCATLGHTAPLDTMRGYIQGWLARSDEAFTPQNARRVFTAANKILRAGEIGRNRDGDENVPPAP